jgi:hypothetical protein
LAFQQNTGSKNAKGVHHSEAKTRTAFIILKQNANGVHYSEAKTRTAFIILKQNANGVHHSEAERQRRSPF